MNKGHYPSTSLISVRQETPTDWASFFRWPNQQGRLTLSTYDLVEHYFIIFGHFARGSIQVLMVRVLLIKIVEKLRGTNHTNSW